MRSDFEPTLESVKRTPSFHKTDSLDYLVILFGRLTMLMGDDDEVTLEAGDVVIQQGVMQGWRVESDEPVRMFGVLIAGETAQR
jgi:mannose-6-phosphate isomerase-like protein (cupin superfamily)